ncbi:hypothetical protein B0H63DRAFT_487590, partial [Podospora didyma]
MAPADTLSPPGSSSYSSNTLTVGDGTWDFTKNTFLLPNLVGLNFETMQYNGMGNRFATLTQYHSLITGHAVLAALTFLFIIPFAVLLARFYSRAPGSAIRYHAYLNILAVGFTTVVFILGFMAVGPPRNLTNPHHGIGVAIYVLILLQAIGGRLVRSITGRSLRVHLHRWSGRLIALLGIAQVPLGLTLYGSPRYLFILFALWMAFLVLLYFILDYRDQGRREHYMSGGGHTHGHDTEVSSKSGRGGMGWLGPLAAGAGIWTLLRGRKKRKDTERGSSRSPSPSGRSHSHRGPEVIPSPRGSDSYYDEKRTERRTSGGGFMNKVFGAGAALGAGALVARMMKGRDRGRTDEYSAVSTETPSRRPTKSGRRPTYSESDYTERTEEIRRHDGRHDGRHDRHSPLLPPPSDPVMAAHALSAAEPRPLRPMTPPRASHAGHSRFESNDGSDYSSYVSPSRRYSERRKSSGGVGKGILAGLTFGFLGKKAKDARDRREEERLRDEEDRRRDEEDRRAGNRTSKYTGDGYPTPTRPMRQGSRQRPRRPRPPPSGIATTASAMSESSIEPRGDTPYDPAPVHGHGGPPVPVPGSFPPPAFGSSPTFVPGAAPAVPGGRSSRPPSRSRYDGETVSMPPMSADPQGVLHESRRGDGGAAAAAAAAAAASASALAAQEEEDRRRRGRTRGDTPPGPSASVKVKVYEDRDNITLRRLTDEEARREAEARRRRNDSVSSISEADTPTNRRYRRERDSSQRRAEQAAEQHAETAPLAPLSPPNPAFAHGRRPQGKDSAYYSGQPGPSGGMAGAGATVSSLASPGGSHGTFSALSPTPSGPLPTTASASAADRRQRRRLERRDQRKPGVEF